MSPLSIWRKSAIWLLETITRQRKTWRHAGHVVAYFILMAAAIPLSDPLKKMDWLLLDALDVHNSEWPERVALVDLEWNLDPAHIEDFRLHLAGTLKALATLEPPPAMVVLDVSISTTPLKLEELKSAFDALRKKSIPIIQVTDLDKFNPETDHSIALEHQGQKILHNHSGALYGHSFFKYGEHQAAWWYKPCEPIQEKPPVGSPKNTPAYCIPAIPELVATLVAQTKRSTGQYSEESKVFTPGDDKKAEQYTWRWHADAGFQQSISQPTQASPELGKHIVIVGNLEYDRLGMSPRRSGPVLLGWAIGDRIALGTTLLRDPRWGIAMALTFSSLALGLFAVLRRLDARSRNIEWATIGTIVGTIAILSIMILMLFHGLQSAYYQVSYVLIGIIMTTGLARNFTLSEIRDRALYTKISNSEPDAPPKWDVFISYSHSPHENIDRVRRDLVEPLRRMSTPDGALKVFFDESSIRVGNSWYMDLAEGIELSRCFVALYSSDYFRKSFCQFELRKAVVRDIVAQGRGFRVLPFKLDANADPLPEFSHLQYRVPANPAEMLQAVQAALAEQGIHAA